MGSSALMSIDLGCRGAVVGLSLLVAAVLLRDRYASTVARLSAALLVGAAASAINSAPTMPWPWPWRSLPILAIASGNSAVFWLWARAVFDDDFELRRWHGALWMAIAGLQLFAVSGAVRWRALGLAIDWTLSFTYLGLALLAAAQTLATWRADLVASRRRLRIVVLIGASAYIAFTAFVSFSPPPLGSGSAVGSLASALVLCVLVGLGGWSLLRAETRDGAGFVVATGDNPRSAAMDAKHQPAAIDPALLRRLEHLMTVERGYRREGLTIGMLAAGLCVPEYRLRQLINGALGYRNFNAFLNRYRIEEAKTALADPERAEVPVLTIAMDAGFQSIGPFNRAFKAATKLTPTEFRRLALASSAAPPSRQRDSLKIGHSI